MDDMVQTQANSMPLEQLQALSDEALLLRYRDRADRAAFAVLVKRYEQPLFSYLCRYCNDSSAADDIFQMSFLQVHLRCDSFDATREFRPWLYTIAANYAVNLRRYKRNKPVVSLDRCLNFDDGLRVGDLVEGDDADPAEQIASEEEFAELRKLVAELPPNTRNALLLVYFQGKKYREAAAELDVPVGTVKSRVHSAIESLSQRMRQARAQRPR